MNFIGSNCDFNNKLREVLKVNYTVVSNIDGDYTTQIDGDNIILILPIDSMEEYTKHTGIGFNKMIDSAFYGSMKTYTTIYLFMHKHINVNDVADVINNFDKNNLVDNIWIYPKLDKIQLRDNLVENLPWQKLYNNSII